MNIRIETIEGEAGAEVGSDLNGTGTEIMIIVAVAGLAVLALIMIGNQADTVALRHVEALITAGAAHPLDVEHLPAKELLARPGMDPLYVLEALKPKLNIIQSFSWIA